MSASTSMMALVLIASGFLSGCGDSTPPSAAGKARTVDLESAKRSLATPTRVRGKSLPADSNLSARERRALKQEGQLPK
jgi:hypothetical protein